MLYRAKIDKDIDVKSCKIVGNNPIYGYELVNTYFVDNSGFGTEGGCALTFDTFLDKVKVGLFYGIKEAGQFQVYIGEYKKVSRKVLNNNLGIVSSKLIKNNTRLIIYKNGDKVLRLYNTDVIKWQGDKIILNTGGWDTVTTRKIFNQFLSNGYEVFRKKGITYISKFGIDDIEFKDGIELPL